MTTRTVTQTVTFRHPFRLAGLKYTLPAGDYCTETDEERLEGVSFVAYRRIKVLVHLPQRKGRPGISETVWVDPIDLDTALAEDGAADLAGTESSAPDPRQITG
ncbi:MAG: hypothetical protein ACMVO3_21285 [Thalassobaculum sp.]